MMVERADANGVPVRDDRQAVLLERTWSMSGQHHHESHGGHEAQSHAHHHHPAPDAENLVQCPVMPNNLVDPEQAEQQGLYRDYEGKRYWFCCAECGPLWDADPARYAHAA